MTSWHPYAHSAQRSATVWLAVLGVASAWGWAAITRRFSIDVPWWIDAPAVFGFYGLLYWLYDRFLWGTALFRALHGVPNLSGRYKVTVRTSHDNHEAVREASAVIAQTWSRVVVRLETEFSTSTSKTAWLQESPGVGFSIAYIYSNMPRPSAPAELVPHEGTAVIVFDAIGKGKGTYYTGRGRVNFGELEFEPGSRTKS